MSISLSDKELKEKLASGELILSDSSGKSDIWENFKLIVNAETEKNVGHVQCQKCYNFFSYNSAKSGTSHLRRHHCNKKPSSKVTEFFKPQTPSVDKNEKQIVLQAAIKMCSKDLRPFDILSGEGFIHFAQTLINIGAKRGVINVSDILPHPTTVSRNTVETAEKLRRESIPYLNEKIIKGFCSASTDMWTDDFRKRSFTAVTLHYFDEEWNLISKLLFTCIFPDESKTGFNIRKEIINRFTKLGFSTDALEKMTFVTDRGSNIVNALQPYNRLDCMAHVINTVLRNLFHMDYLKENNSAVFETLIGAKSLVTYLKQSGLVNRLSKSVHQETESRWNSKLLMLESIYENFSEISDLLSERQEGSRLDSIDVNVLPHLIEFLLPFRDASMALEKEKEITLPFVLLWYKKLLAHSELKAEDEDFMKDIKSRCNDFLKEKFILKDEHKLATFLCPSFRQLRMLNEDEKERTIELIKKMLQEMNDERNEASDSSIQSVEQISKKRKTESKFMEWEDESEKDDCDNELDIYFKLKAPACTKELNIWWKNHQSRLINLSKIAKKILSIPATSASCERNFSSAGFLMNERRSRLDPDVIDASLFLHANL